MSIEIRQLTKVFGDQIAVDHLDFTARKGEILGFLGPNGAGKTTTMKMICGYLPPTKGTALICGIDVVENPIEAKRKIGYLPEHNPLYKDMYVREYLDFFARLTQIPNPRKRVGELIEMTGLTQEQNKKIGSLSKGYRQRMGLSQALLHDPEVLILDEPTSGLDPNQLIEIRQLIRQAGEEKTLLFSSHIMQEVQALCHRVVIINKGKLVADDEIRNLLDKGKPNRVILVEFAAPVPLSELQRIEYVERVVDLGQCRYQLISPTDRDVRSHLFKIASEHSWTIRELKEERSSVEEMFSILTKSES